MLRAPAIRPSGNCMLLLRRVVTQDVRARRVCVYFGRLSARACSVQRLLAGASDTVRGPQSQEKGSAVEPARAEAEPRSHIPVRARTTEFHAHTVDIKQQGVPAPGRRSSRSCTR